MDQGQTRSLAAAGDDSVAEPPGRRSQGEGGGVHLPDPQTGPGAGPGPDPGPGAAGPLLGGLSRGERQTLGRLCKRLLDAGRAQWLRRATGLNARLVYYCLEADSPENCLLLASC